jgi:hypothetical protein
MTQRASFKISFSPIPVFVAMCVSVLVNFHFFARARPTHQAERSEWVCAISGAVNGAREKAATASRTGPVDQVRAKLAIINNSQNFQVNTQEGCGRKRLEGLLFNLDFVAQQDSNVCGS